MKLLEPLQIEKYGIILQQLTKEDIELVRNWRNDPKISKHMSFRNYITPQMQEAWFESINSSGADFYFIIKHGVNRVGLANIKNVSWSDKTGEAGLFIYEDNYLSSLFPFQVICTLNDFAFYELELNFLTAHMLKNNQIAIRFNKRLGYIILENQDGIENQKYVLSRVGYEANIMQVKDLILKTLDARKT